MASTVPMRRLSLLRARSPTLSGFSRILPGMAPAFLPSALCTYAHAEPGSRHPPTPARPGARGRHPLGRRLVTTTPVTIEQAAAILGVSASTIRRRIKAGNLRVEEARRPQGVVWLVHLPPGTAPASGTATVDTAPVDTTAATPQPAGDAIAAMIQATLTPIVAPL